MRQKINKFHYRRDSDPLKISNLTNAVVFFVFLLFFRFFYFLLPFPFLFFFFQRDFSLEVTKKFSNELINECQPKEFEIPMYFYESLWTFFDACWFSMQTFYIFITSAISIGHLIVSNHIEIIIFKLIINLYYWRIRK